jgi:large-conductance mechanosensitive channel
MTLFNDFIYEQGLLGVTLGTIIGFAITNLIKDIKIYGFIPLFKKYKINKSKIGLLSSFLEFFLIFIILYLSYYFIILPLFNNQIKKQKEEKKQLNKWRNNVLNELDEINYGNVYL